MKTFSMVSDLGMWSPRHIVLLAFVAFLFGCCESKWCQFEASLKKLPQKQTEVELTKLSDQDLLDFIAWKVEHTEPAGFHYPYSVVTKRANTIVAPIIARLAKGDQPLVDMEYVSILAEIKEISPQAFSDNQLVLINKRCEALYSVDQSLEKNYADFCARFHQRQESEKARND